MNVTVDELAVLQQQQVGGSSSNSSNNQAAQLQLLHLELHTEETPVYFTASSSL
jgi:hypothetical protein